MRRNDTCAWFNAHGWMDDEKPKVRKTSGVKWSRSKTLQLIMLCGLSTGTCGLVSDSCTLRHTNGSRWIRHLGVLGTLLHRCCRDGVCWQFQWSDYIRIGKQFPSFCDTTIIYSELNAGRVALQDATWSVYRSNPSPDKRSKYVNAA